MDGSQRAPGHDQASVRPARKRSDIALDLLRVTHIDRSHLHPEQRRHGLRHKPGGNFAMQQSPRGTGCAIVWGGGTGAGSVASRPDSERFRSAPRIGRSRRARLRVLEPAARAGKAMSGTKRRGLTRAIASLTSAPLSLAPALSWPAGINAHDIYTVLKDSSGRSCCGDHDCRPAHYRLSPAGVQMLISGKWIFVPNETIQYRALDGDTGETAGGHWCGLTGAHVTVTYCAILPPSSAHSTQAESSLRQKPPSSSGSADEVIE
jgi:hypothetical protein